MRSVCRCSQIAIPARVVRECKSAPRFVVAFEHTPGRWHYWGDFETHAKARLWCVGKFIATSCGVRIVALTPTRRIGKITNPFPKSLPVAPRPLTQEPIQ